MSEYRVALDVYNGPLDLLLYLIRREEIEIYDIPIARITQQYLQYVDLLRQLDPEIVSEFLILASTLMEIKSRMLLPKPPAEEGDEEMVDPRLELVRQLLEYKKFKDVARHLDDAVHEQAKRFARSPVMPAREPDEIDLEALDIWDLFDAFNRMLEQTGQRETGYQIGVDDTPMALHAEDILDSIERAGGAEKFEAIFAGRTRAEMIGLFLALLELIRQARVRASQDRPFGVILLVLLDRTPIDIPEPERRTDDSAHNAAETTISADGDDDSLARIEVDDAGADAAGEEKDIAVVVAAETQEDDPDRSSDDAVDPINGLEIDDDTE